MSISGVISAGITFVATGYNPQAAAAAYTIGAGVEALVLSPANKVNGPKSTDLQVQISSYGAVLPIIEGTCRIPGNVWWSTDKIPTEHTTSSGGKGGSKTDTTTETLSVSFAIAFCEGEAFSFRRMWFDKKLMIDFGHEADAAAIIASGFLASSIRFYPGSETQDPDPLIESYDGVGNADAKLGTCYIVFENFQLAEFGDRIPNIEVEIIKSGTSGITHKNIAAVTVDDMGAPSLRGRAWASERVQYIFRPNVALGFDSIAIFKTSDGAEQVPLGVFGLPVGGYPTVTWGEPFPVKTRDKFLIEKVEYTTNIVTGLTTQQLRIVDPLGVDEDGAAITTVALLSWVDYVSATSHMGDNERMTSYDQDSGTVAFSIRSGSINQFSERIVIWNRGDAPIWYFFRTPTVASATVCCAQAQAAGKIFALIYNDAVGKMQLHIIDRITATADAVYDGPSWTPAVFSSDCMEGIRTDGSTTWAWALDGVSGAGHAWKWLVDGTYVPLADFVNGENDAGSATTLMGGPGTYIDDTHMIMYGSVQMNAGVDPIFRLQLVHWGAAIPDGVPLSDIVDRRLAQRNITGDTSELTDIVDGLMMAKQMSTADILTFLASTYYFNLIADGSGGLYAKKLGGAPDGTVLISDLAAHDFGAEVPDAFPDARTKEQDLPQYWSINFTDPLADYLIGNVPAQRQNTQAAQRLTLDVTAISMSAEKAARIVDIAKTVSQVERMKGTCSADYRMKKYLPGDVILFVDQDGGITYRRRLQKITDHQGLLQIEHVADDAYAFQSVATGTGAGMAASVVTPGGSVMLQLMDIPIMRDEDDNTGFYARIAPATTAWRGGSLYRTDAGGVLFEGSVSTANPIGVTLNALAAYVGPKVFDEGSAVDVNVYGGLALASGTRAAPIPALIGREIVYYRTATALGGAKYRLTGMLRYQRGTEDATTHAVGERFVLLGIAGTLRVDHGAADFGKVHNYTAVAPGRPLETGDSRSFVNNGRGLLPFTPVCLGYGEDGNGGLLFTWRRRTRLETVFGTEAPLGELVEEYRVDFSTTADFAVVTTFFYTPVPRLALDATQRLMLPSPFYWRPVQIGSGIGSSPALPPPGTPGILPGAPADTLATLRLDIDPTGAADGAAIVDSSGTPATVFNSGCRIDGGRIVFSDLYTRLKVDGGTRFNLGTADFSLAFDLLCRSKLDTPEEQTSLFNYGPESGVLAGQIKIFLFGDGRLLVYFIDYGSAYGSWVLESGPGLNDGRSRSYRIARSSGVFYLIIDGVVVDALTASVSQTPLTGIPLIIGGFKGSMGRITLKTP